MKYIIECPYCGNSYTVYAQPGTAFTCRCCGGANSIKDAIKHIEISVEPTKHITYDQQIAAQKLAQQRTENLKKLYKDEELQFLGKAHEADYSSDEYEYMPDTEFSDLEINPYLLSCLIVISIIALCLIGAFWGK